MNTSIEDSQVKREKKRHNKIGRRSRDASRQDPHSVVNDSYIERISQLQRSSLRNKGSKLHIRLFNARVLHQEMNPPKNQAMKTRGLHEGYRKQKLCFFLAFNQQKFNISHCSKKLFLMILWIGWIILASAGTGRCGMPGHWANH